MDPDETLRLIRLTIEQMDADEDPAIKAAHAEEVAEHFEALDEWLSKGGFAPNDWFPEPAERIRLDTIATVIAEEFSSLVTDADIVRRAEAATRRLTGRPPV